MKDLLTSPDFKRYRKKQVEEIINFIKSNMWKDDTDYSYLKGSIEMARRIIRLPGELVQDKGIAAQLNQDIQADMNRVIVEMIRSETL